VQAALLSQCQRDRCRCRTVVDPNPAGVLAQAFQERGIVELTVPDIFDGRHQVVPGDHLAKGESSSDATALLPNIRAAWGILARWPS
jgi:hypothetical protein